MDPIEIEPSKIWDVRGLYWSTGSSKIALAVSGMLGMSFPVVDEEDGWSEQRFRFDCNIAPFLENPGGLLTQFKVEKMVPHFNIHTFRFDGDGDNGGFTLIRYYNTPQTSLREIPFEFDMGGRAEDKAFIERVGFTFTAIGEVENVEPVII